MLNRIFIVVLFATFFKIDFLYGSDADSPLQVLHQGDIALKAADQITKMTEMINSLNDQIATLKEQLDLQKQIDAGEAVLGPINDVKALYGSVLGLQGAFTETVENVEDLNAQIESYFGPIQIKDVEWGDRYPEIQVGRQSAYLSLVAALELKQKTEEAEGINWSLMEENIKALDSRRLNEYIAEALKSLLTLQFFQAKAQAQRYEDEATNNLSRNNEEINKKNADQVINDALYKYAGSISSIGFETPHNFGSSE